MLRVLLAVVLYSAGLFFPLQCTASRLQAQTGSPPSSSPNHAFSADRILAFAAQLMQQREYYRAITEYRRFLFSFPHDKRQSKAQFRIGLAFYGGRDYGEALKAFGEVAELHPDSPHGKLARLWQGECRMRQGKFEAAENLFGAAGLILADEVPGDHAVYRHAWALLYQQQWQEARKQFQSLPFSHSFRETARHIAEAIPYIEHSPRKSPVLAGVLSAALPGSGQFYVGRRGDALLALLLNTLFVAGIVEAISQDRPAVAGLLGFFEAGWYAGNILGAVNGAHKYNALQGRKFIEEMEQQFPYEPPRSSLTTPTLGIRVSLGF